jgi:hypothetical protein
VTTAKPASAPPPAGPLPTTLSQQQLEAPVQKASAAVSACLSREAATNPDAPSMLTLRFEVTPSGDALNVLVEPPALRGRPVLGCLQRVLADLSWSPSSSTSRAMMGLKMPAASATAAPAPAPASPVTTTPATRTKPRLKD